MKLEFDSEEDRQLLLMGLERIAVPWTILEAPKMFATQQRVVKMHQAVNDAPLVGELEPVSD